MRSSTEHLSFKLLRERLFWRIAARAALSRIRLKCKCTYLHICLFIYLFIYLFISGPSLMKVIITFFYYYCYCMTVTQVSSKTKIWPSRGISNLSNFANVTLTSVSKFEITKPIENRRLLVLTEFMLGSAKAGHK